MNDELIKQIKKPVFRQIPLSEGLAMRAPLVYHEKMDGKWAVQQIGKALCAGELMRDGTFWAFDLLALDGSDCRQRPLTERLHWLQGVNVPIVASGHGGEFLEAILARGGEGVVIKAPDSPFGVEWIKCKRETNYHLIVAEKNIAKSQIRLIDNEGVDCGWVPWLTGFDQIQIGQTVEVLAYGRHASGKLREARRNQNPN